jgi:hypothetical protein
MSEDDSLVELPVMPGVGPEKYLDALLEVVYERVKFVHGETKTFPSSGSLLSHIAFQTSSETYLFLRYNGLTAIYVDAWLKRRSEKESKG